MKAFVRYDDHNHTFTICFDTRFIKIEIGDLSEEGAKYLIEELEESFKEKVKIRHLLNEGVSKTGGEE